jgi:hypothetical protein
VVEGDRQMVAAEQIGPKNLNPVGPFEATQIRSRTYQHTNLQPARETRSHHFRAEKTVRSRN